MPGLREAEDILEGLMHAPVAVARDLLAAILDVVVLVADVVAACGVLAEEAVAREAANTFTSFRLDPAFERCRTGLQGGYSILCNSASGP